MRHIVATTAFLAILFVGAFANAADDPTGTWKWTAERGDRKVEMSVKLKLEGDKLTGSVPGRDGAETAIENGSYKDGELKFEVTRARGDNKFTIKYAGKVEGNKITGKITSPGRAGGEARTTDWTATKE